MVKTDRIVKNLAQAINAYGGADKFAKAFFYENPHVLRQHWKLGVPAGARLGLFIGLAERGYEPTPRLYGLRSWPELIGVGLVTKRSDLR
jgi:hypothetical protein